MAEFIGPAITDFIGADIADFWRVNYRFLELQLWNLLKRTLGIFGATITDF